MKKLPSKKNLYLLALLVVTLMGLSIIPTYAKFSSNYVTANDVAGINLSFDIGITNIEEYEQIVVPLGEYKIFNVKIENASSDILYYGVWYRLNDDSLTKTDVTIARLDGTETTTSGSLEGLETKTVSIIIINNTDNDITVDIGVASSITGTSDIEYLGGKKLVSGVAAKPVIPANAPNLDNGNLIPVYYEEDGTYTYTDTETSEEVTVTGVWKKADSSNTNNSWYDYNNKKWANAIIVSDDTKSSYQSADVGTTITDSDIIAFYVWIPRYKYRVWNINRQAYDVDDYSTYEADYYAYPAYSQGIEIEFEQGTASTGNVECSYDVTLGEPENEEDSVLSDNCYYDGSTTAVTTTDSNKSYTDAWYTHPAFTFGDEEIEGFWIGKFETSGSATAPTVIPDVSSLRSQTVSTQFTTAKVFQNYLSSDIDAHMLTNLEWGAVAYLTHSNYGLCYEGSCNGVKHNNSSGYYTGRSGGAIAGSTDLNLANVYPDDSTSTTKYNSNGYYTYKGYFIDYNGNVTTTKDITKVASTTGNITGVYDMSGGVYEYVMGNMVSSSYAFYPSSSGTSWNGSTTLGSQYYNSYSYGTNYNNAIAFNRARLGDATAEVLGATTGSSAWKIGSGIVGSGSSFVYSTISWFVRGGNYSASGSGAFNFYYFDGGSASYSFRSSLS